MAVEQSTTSVPLVELRPAVFRGRPVPGYAVTRDGGVYTFWRLDPGGRIKWSIGKMPRLMSVCRITRTRRYYGVHMRRDGKTLRVAVHSLVAETFFGPRPEGMQVCHNNGNGLDNRVDNLRYDTPTANQADKLKHGTHQYGERNASAKLTNDQAEEIKKQRKAGVKLRVIAERFGVRESTVSRIANGVRRGQPA